MTILQRQQSLQSGSSENLDPQNWDDIRALGHRMLDDMLDYAANIREHPVWSPIPDDVRARFRAALPRAPTALDEVYREFTDFIVALCDRKCASRLHGMGAWRRHRRRHAGGDAGRGTQCQSRRPRSHADRGRAPDRGMDAFDVRLSRRGERDFRHRHVDGEFDGGAGSANGGAWIVRAAIRHRPARRAADGVHVEGGAWLHHQGDGYRGFWQQRIAQHRGRSRASHRCGGLARPDRQGSRGRPASRSLSSARPARSTSARSTISRR